jgi:hypothetical protein
MATVSPPTLSSSPANQQEPWYEDDSVVTIVPKFKVKDGMMEQYMALLPKFIELVKVNEGGACVHYGFVSCDDIIFLDFLHDIPLFSLFGINRCSSNRVCAAVVVVVEPPVAARCGVFLPPQVGPSEDGFVICREGYVSADAVLRHLDNVMGVLNEALQVRTYGSGVVYMCLDHCLL